MKTDVDQYVESFDGIARERLEELRVLIKNMLPEAEEKKSYGVLGYFQKSYIVYLAAFKNHIGMYPLPSGNEAFLKELAHYQAGKGTVRFPHDKPLPLPFIKQLIRNLIHASEERNARR